MSEDNNKSTYHKSAVRFLEGALDEINFYKTEIKNHGKSFGGEEVNVGYFLDSAAMAIALDPAAFELCDVLEELKEKAEAVFSEGQ